MRAATAVLVLGALMLPASAQMPGVARRLRLLLDGYPGEPPAERRELADLRIRCDARERRFQLTDGQVLSEGRLIGDVLERMAGYRPSLVLRGPTDLVRRFCEAPEGQRLRLIGEWMEGSRDFVLGEVTIRDAP